MIALSVTAFGDNRGMETITPPRAKRRRPPAIQHRTGLHATRRFVAGESIVPPVFAEVDPACLFCGRTRRRHLTQMAGGELVVPACQLIHGGGIFAEGPPAPRPRPLAQRMAIATALSPQEARRIASSLGHTTKMPGASYGLDAFRCKKGSLLAADPTSMCHPDVCYAKQGFYLTYHNAVKARHARQEAIRHDLWVEAMICLISDYVAQGTDDSVFRWHDSGDLQSVLHFANICAVAEATPHVRHWIPTRETEMVAEYRARGGGIPPNLAVRISAFRMGDQPTVPPELADLPTSTVHAERGAPIVLDGARRNSTLECRAGLRGNRCDKCRACWDPRVRNVSYPAH